MNILQIIIIEIITRNSDRFTFNFGRALVKIFRLDKNVTGISKSNVRCTKDLGCFTILFIFVLFFALLYLIT